MFSLSFQVHQDPSHTSFRVGPAILTSNKSFTSLELRRKINGFNHGEQYIKEMDEKAAEHEQEEPAKQAPDIDVDTDKDETKNKPEPAPKPVPATPPFWETPYETEGQVIETVGVQVAAPTRAQQRAKQASAKAAAAAERVRQQIVAKHKPKQALPPPKPQVETIFGIALKSKRLAAMARRLGEYILNEGWAINAPVMA